MEDNDRGGVVFSEKSHITSQKRRKKMYKNGTAYRK
jgi:hypothetical protein